MAPGIEHKIQDEVFLRIWDEVRDCTMTSKERGYALYLAVRYLVENTIHGSFVECGVWRGGSVMLMLKTLVALGTGGRDIYLFDTFSGMSEPGEEDVDLHGRAAEDLLDDAKDDPDALIHARATLDDVRKNIADCGYPAHKIHYVRGDVCETAGRIQTGPIALLRLDTDFHDSTKAELEALYPRLNQGGVLIIDDYGHWRGARKAVDEYFSSASRQRTGALAPLLLPVDYTGRVATKQDKPRNILIRPYDYHSPGLDAPDLLPLFPSLKQVMPTARIWAYLRYNAPHVWRVDTRDTVKENIGVLSVDEAILLHALARQFRGRRALEIGCHFGWSSAHLLAAGLKLDIIDPALGNPAQHEAVRDSLDSVREAIPKSGKYRLWAGFSPSVLPAVLRTPFGGKKWSFAFIDGNHDGDAPRQDAEAVMEYMADDAMIVFHDLLSPNVMAGLEACREAGWNIRLYNTMQVMGIAWRGGARPVDHVPDPNLRRPHQAHLAKARIEVTDLFDAARDSRFQVFRKQPHGDENAQAQDP